MTKIEPVKITISASVEDFEYQCNSLIHQGYALKSVNICSNDNGCSYYGILVIPGYSEDDPKKIIPHRIIKQMDRELSRKIWVIHTLLRWNRESRQLFYTPLPCICGQAPQLASEPTEYKKIMHFKCFCECGICGEQSTCVEGATLGWNKIILELKTISGPVKI